MTIDLEGEHRLVGDIYDAAMEPRLWPTVLGRLASLVEANSAAFIATDLLCPDYGCVYHHNVAQELLLRYRDERLDELEMQLLAPPMVERGVGNFFLPTELFGSVENYLAACGPLYERCLKPARIHHAAAVLLDHADYRFGVLGIHRPEEWAPITRQHAPQLERLGRHLRRALQIHRQLTSVRQENARLYRMLDGLTVGVLLLDAAGRVKYGNPVAERLLSRHGAIQLAGGFLRTGRSSQQESLEALIRGATRTGLRECAEQTAGVIGLQGTHGPAVSPLMLTVAPLSEWTGYGELASDGIAAAIFLSDPEQRRRLSRRLLRESFQLTERESDLCESFVNAGTLEAVAEDCGLSLVTVRSYLRDIYQKTGCHSQAELMRLLAGLSVDFEHIA